jgi:hypothetical protein
LAVFQLLCGIILRLEYLGRERESDVAGVEKLKVSGSQKLKMGEREKQNWVERT